MIEWKEAYHLLYELEVHISSVFRVFSYHDKRDTLDKDVVEVLDNLQELVNLFNNMNCIQEWQKNPIALLDICNAYTIIEVHHKADTYRSAYGYTK